MVDELPRVLVVEDDEDFRVILKTVLEGVSYPVSFDFVRNFEEMIQFLRDDAIPQLIILNQVDWPDTLRLVRENPQFSCTPVVIMRASLGQEDVDFCRGFERCSYLDKPVNIEDWKARIEELLREHLMIDREGSPSTSRCKPR